MTAEAQRVVAAGRAAPEPVVLPLDPRCGWQEADLPRRGFTSLGVLLAAAWLVSLPVVEPQNSPVAAVTVSTALILLAGPPCCYSLARVLRPHPPGVSWERIARHWCAAVASAYGFALLASFVGGWTEIGFAPTGFGAGWLFIVTATALGPVTLAWGLVAATWRAASRL